MILRRSSEEAEKCAFLHLRREELTSIKCRCQPFCFLSRHSRVLVVASSLVSEVWLDEKGGWRTGRTAFR